MQSQNETNEGQEDTFAAFKEPKQQQNGLPVDDFPKKSTITGTLSLPPNQLTMRRRHNLSYFNTAYLVFWGKESHQYH